MTRWWLQPQPSADQLVRPVSDGAWPVLALINDWIKHAETKAAATLAACGVLGGVLYALVRNESDSGFAFRITAITCAVFLFAAGFGAAMALRPRLRSRENIPNLLYYDHIARAYRARADAFTDALTALVRDHDALAAAVAGQVWANAQVARRKYAWGNAGVTGFLLALAALGLAAALAALKS